MDNEIKKYALIVNGDTEARHLQNVEQSVETLKSENYEITVVSTQETKKADHVNFFTANASNLESAIQQIANKMDDNDQFIIYTTGHGGKDGLVLPDGEYNFDNFASRANQLNYGKRIIVMDQCFSGNQFSKFANDRTAFIADGMKNETNTCQNFSPYFFENSLSVDSNKDGLITLQERFAHAVSNKNEGVDDSKWLYLNPMNEFDLDGRSTNSPASFPNSVIDVENAADLKLQIARLMPGQLALVTFSADWCGPCQGYKDTFNELAQKYDGRILMLRIEGKNGSENEWTGEFEINAFPTVAVFDFQGVKMEVADRNNPMQSIRVIDPMEEILEKMNKGDVEEQLVLILNFDSQLKHTLDETMYNDFVEHLKTMSENSDNLELSYASTALLVNLECFDFPIIDKFFGFFDCDWGGFSQELKISFCNNSVFLKSYLVRDEYQIIINKLIFQLNKTQDPKVGNELAIALTQFQETESVSDYVSEILPMLNGTADEQNRVLYFFKHCRTMSNKREFNEAVAKKCVTNMGLDLFVELLDKGRELTLKNTSYEVASRRFMELYSGLSLELAIDFIPKLQNIVSNPESLEEVWGALYSIRTILSEENIRVLFSHHKIEKEKIRHLIGSTNDFLAKFLYMECDFKDRIVATMVAMGEYKNNQNKKFIRELLLGVDFNLDFDALSWVIHETVALKDYPTIEKAIQKSPVEIVRKIASEFFEHSIPVPEKIRSLFCKRLLQELRITHDTTIKIKYATTILDLDGELPDSVYKIIFASRQDITSNDMTDFIGALYSKEIYLVDAFKECSTLFRQELAVFDKDIHKYDFLFIRYLIDCIEYDKSKFSLDAETIEAIKSSKIFFDDYTLDAVFELFGAAEYYDEDTIKTAIRHMANSDNDELKGWGWAAWYLSLSVQNNHEFFDLPLIEEIVEKYPEYFFTQIYADIQSKMEGQNVKLVPNPFYSEDHIVDYHMPETVPEDFASIFNAIKNRQEQSFYDLPSLLNVSGNEKQIEMSYSGSQTDISVITFCNDGQCVKISFENIIVNDGRLILKLEETAKFERNPYFHIIMIDGKDIKIPIAVVQAE